MHLVERPNDDFAVSMARQLFFSTYQLALYERLQVSADATLAGVAGKAVKEVDYHRDHATQWVLRLGDGTEESHRRMQAGLERLWPYVDELFATDDLEQSLVADGVAVDASTLRPGWDAYVDGVLAEATLTRPEGLRTPPGGGRRGVHTEALGYLLAEMQHLHRAHPGATVVTIARDAPTVDDARAAAAAVLDPEVPVLTIADLGVLRDVEVRRRRHASSSPSRRPTPAAPRWTSSGATSRTRCAPPGFAAVEVRTVLSPAWTTDWMTDDGPAGPADYGIAPAVPAPASAGPVALALSVRCPQCGSPRHPRDQPVRLHGVQVAVGVQRLPRAVRPLQGDLR